MPKGAGQVRLLSSLLGAVLGVLCGMLLPGSWGWATGLAVFLAVSAAGHAFWRARADAEDIRADLEDRTRNTI